MNLNNKVVLITGASSGIGYAVAEKLARKNCSLILLSRRSDILQKLLSDNKITDAKGAAYKCDVTNHAEVKEAINAGYKKFGRIDAAILSSGTSHRTNPETFDAAAGKEIMDVNFYGIVNCLDVLIPLMKKQDKGIIAGISSIAESRGYPRSGFYSASKAAMSILLESIRIELRGTSVKVLTVKPGFVRTPMTDKNEFGMPFLLEPDKAADIIVSGIEKEKRIIQFPLPLVLGAKLVRIIPDALFDRLAYLHLNKFRHLFRKTNQ
jgi:short-subunit dehydrogenase